MGHLDRADAHAAFLEDLVAKGRSVSSLQATFRHSFDSLIGQDVRQAYFEKVRRIDGLPPEVVSMVRRCLEGKTPDLIPEKRKLTKTT